MVESLYLPLVLLAAVAGTTVAFFAWLHRDRPGARPLALFLVAAGFWSVTEALSVATPGTGTVFWTRAGLAISGVVPLAWLLTVIEYTGREEWLTPRVAALLLVEPVVFILLVWTNPADLVWTGIERVAVGESATAALAYGPAFWAHQAYSYLLVAVGGGVLVRLILRTDGVYRAQGTALLAAIALPMIGNALYVFDLFPRGLDPTGAGYVLSGTVVAAAMLRQELLSFAPVTRDLGREAALSDVADPVITLDRTDRVVDANDAAEGLFATGEYLGRDVRTVLPELDGSLDDGSGEETDREWETKAELRLERNGEVRYYDVRVSDLYGSYGAVSGRVVSLRDVTERRQREQRLDVLNRLLRHNLRNELNIVRGNVELARRDATDESVEERLENAVETVDIVVQRSDKVGTLSRTLESEDDGPVDLARILRASAAADRDGVTLALPDSLPVAAGPSLSVAFDELVTNAVEHNDSDPTVTVSVDERRSDEEYVVVTVADDGPGIDEQEWRTVMEGEETPLRHASGIGLWLVNWVVERAGGRLDFENTDEGCTVRVRLPRADESVAPEDGTERESGTDSPETPARQS